MSVWLVRLGVLHASVRFFVYPICLQINYFNQYFSLRVVQCCDTLGAAIGVEGSSKVLAMLGRKICLIDRNTGQYNIETY